MIIRSNRILDFNLKRRICFCYNQPISHNFHTKFIMAKKRGTETLDKFVTGANKRNGDDKRDGEEADGAKPNGQRKRQSSVNSSTKNSNNSNNQKKTPNNSNNQKSIPNNSPYVLSESLRKTKYPDIPKEYKPGEETPLQKLEKVLSDTKVEPNKSESVVFWMRMHDLRIHDSRALSHAAQEAHGRNSNLFVLHILSPEDFELHDRSPRRIDYVLRQLRCLKTELEQLNVPLIVKTCKKRNTIPQTVIDTCSQVSASSLYANIEYEIDELNRDIDTVKLCEKNKIEPVFEHDCLVVPPGCLKNKTKSMPFMVYTPYFRAWADFVINRPEYLDTTSDVESFKAPKVWTELETDVPEYVENFKCDDAEEMARIWPAGRESGCKMLERFCYDTNYDAENLVDYPLENCDSKISDSTKSAGKNNSSKSKLVTRLERYAEDRSRVDLDIVSRLSVYLASGTLSSRECIRESIKIVAEKKNKSFRTKDGQLNMSCLDTDRGSNIGSWVQEVAWRDFYGQILANFPRVNRRLPLYSQFDNMHWKEDPEVVERWKNGQTGFPLIDAGMRQLAKTGYMHNRCRMSVAMFLVKDLLQDWRVGEQHFMKNLIDGDFASNNGGWQWSSSLNDPASYYRMFNPILQAQKGDPSGRYIRRWVPELSELDDATIHEPYNKLSTEEIQNKYNYFWPLVDHAAARAESKEFYASEKAQV